MLVQACSLSHHWKSWKCCKRKTSAFHNAMLPFSHYCIVSVQYLLKIKNLIFRYMYLIKTPRQTLRSGKSTELFIFLDIEIKIYFGSGKRKIFEIPWGIRVCLRALSFYTCQKFDFFFFPLYCTYWQLGNLANKQLVCFSCSFIRKNQEEENIFYYLGFLLPFLSYAALVLTCGR